MAPFAGRELLQLPEMKARRGTGGAEEMRPRCQSRGGRILGAGLAPRALSLFFAERGRDSPGPRWAARSSCSRALLRGEPVRSRPGGPRAAAAPLRAVGGAGGSDRAGRRRWPWKRYQRAAPVQAAPIAERAGGPARAPRGRAARQRRGRQRVDESRERVGPEQRAGGGEKVLPPAAMFPGCPGRGGSCRRGVAGRAPTPPRGPRPRFAAPLWLRGSFRSRSRHSPPLFAGRSGPAV